LEIVRPLQATMGASRGRAPGPKIPEAVEEITAEERDSENGYGGKTVTVPVDRG